MNLKNILYIESNLDGTVGGSHHSLFFLVKYINRNRYQPIVLFYQENMMVPDFKNICEVYFFKQNHVFTIEKDFPGLYKMINRGNYIKKPFLLYQKAHNLLFCYIPNLINIYRFIKKHGIDLIHVNNYPSLTDWLIISKLLNVKIVSHLRGFYYISKFEKILVKFYDKVISTSNWVTYQMKEQNISCKNVVLIHNGIDVDAVKIDTDLSENILTELNITDKSPVIGVIGNIRKWKGQHVAIEAMKLLIDKYKNIRCIIVGSISNSPNDTEYLKYLNELILKYNLEKYVLFTGFRKDIYNIINSLDIIVHTSILPEPFGRVLLEGMILRKPVIATNQGGPLEIIEDGVSGLLVPPENPKLLSDKISFLVENKHISKTMGENARRRIEEKFSIERNVKEIEDVYLNLLK